MISQGLENNDGIFMVASTNHLEQLDPGLSSRPSRFDRKYLFPLPSEEERVLYCDFWRERLKGKQVKIEFPKKLCPAVALITDGFSFAYMQEAFVTSLLAIAQRRSESLDEGMEKKKEKVEGGGDGNDGDDDGDKDLDEYELWREIKLVVKALRDDMDNTQVPTAAITRDTLSIALEQEREAQRPAAGSGSGPIPMNQSTTLPLRPAGDLATMRHKNPRLQGMVVDVDAQNVPIINDEGFFMGSHVGSAGDSQLL
jgi:SpoVK/Ycf46/Vps4 family AAA+-type ATPase